ncbi:unnamed protein product, partial [Heterosigma akashiwo]
GTNKKVQCNYCDKVVIGSTGLQTHLRGSGTGVSHCPRVPPETREAFRAKFEADTNAKRQRLTAHGELVARPQAELGGGPGGVQGAIQVFGGGRQEDRDCARDLLLKFFYSSGVPFSVAGNEYLQKALRALDPVFKPPTVGFVRKEGLQKNHDEIQIWKQEVIQASNKGTLMGDGWVNCKRQPLINFLLSTSRGTIHLKTIDTSGESKDAPLIAGVFEEQINAVGPDNVSSVVADNPGEMEAA